MPDYEILLDLVDGENMEKDLIYLSDITFERNERGQYVMYVRFSNGAVWRPRWSHVTRIYDDALFVEHVNKRLIGKGKPKTYLVFPILEILKSRGYLKESLFVCDMSAQTDDDGIVLGSRIYLESENFKETKKRAQRTFAERIINRVRDLPTFKNKPLKLSEMIVTEYVKKRTWKEIVEEDYYF